MTAANDHNPPPDSWRLPPQHAQDVRDAMDYLYKRQGETGHPVCYEFVTLCLSEGAAPRGLSGIKETS
jgi:hypothetical protein